MSNPPKHTPLPWKWGSPNGALTGKNGQVIAWHAGERGPAWKPSSEEESTANERILQASAAMYQALRMLYDEAADYIRINNLGDVHHNWSMQCARAALRLAEDGKAS